MSKQEVKEELKETMGDPHVRARLQRDAERSGHAQHDKRSS
jgi:flagellar biosynthesis protein FlhB